MADAARSGARQEVCYTLTFYQKHIPGAPGKEMLNLYRERILVVPRLRLAPVGQQLQRHLLFTGLIALARASPNSTTTAAGTTTAPALGLSSFVSAFGPTLPLHGAGAPLALSAHADHRVARVTWFGFGFGLWLG